MGLPQMDSMGLNCRKAPSGVSQTSGLAGIIHHVCEKKKSFKLFNCSVSLKN